MSDNTSADKQLMTGEEKSNARVMMMQNGDPLKSVSDEVDMFFLWDVWSLLADRNFVSGSRLPPKARANELHKHPAAR